MRKQTDKIKAEITALVSELKLNGMDGADLALLTSASSHLQNLSQEDMQKVVNALQSASMATQEQGRQQSLITAFQGQKDVSLKLKSLAADLAAQESQKEVPSKLAGLIARQTANIRQTKTLANITADQLSGAQKTTHDVVSSEQNAIGGELDVLVKVLSAKPDLPAAAGAPDATKAVLDSLNSSGLSGTAQAAAQLTTAGPFPDAVTKQTAVRDLLISAYRAAMTGVDVVSQLQQAKTELSQLTSDQKDLAATAKQSGLDGTILADRQARIEDRAMVTQALLKALSPAASSQLNQAEQSMEASSGALAAAKNPADTAPQQLAVVDALQKTSALLDQQIAAAEKAAEMSPTDKLAQLQQLQSEIKQAEQSPQNSSALQKAQQDATTVSPQAEAKLSDAQDQLQQPQPNTAAAQQSLAQASALVQQQEDALQQAAQAYQQLAQASQQLQQAQQDAAAANQAIQQSTSGDLTQAAHDLTQAQQALAQTEQTANQDGAPQAAQQAMQQAAAALAAATNQAVQAQGAQAQAQDQQAQAAMQQAQAGLGQAMAQIQQQAQGQGQGQGQGPGQGPGQGQGQPPQQPGQNAQGLAGGAEAPEQGGQVLGGVGAGGVAQVVGGLKPKDRDAIAQYQAEKSPPEYAPLVQQYLKNLADSSQSR